MVRKSSWVAAGALVAFSLNLGEARAQSTPPATVRVLQIGAGFRYGIDFEEGDMNPFGPGLGLDAGYTLPSAIYFGGVFDYFFGDTEEGPGYEVDANVWQVMAEGGYDFALSDSWVLRGKGGVGYGALKSESCVSGVAGNTCSDDSDGGLAVAPGLSLMYLGPSFSFSADGRYDMVFADETLNGFIFSFGIGF